MLCYIHIPFCASKCGYCGFNSMAGALRFKEKYLAALELDLAESLRESFGESRGESTPESSGESCGESAPEFRTQNGGKRPIKSVFIGGGTPNTLSPRDFERIFEMLRPFLGESCETTIELNPNASTDLAGFVSLGINRFSIGLQSFRTDKLALLEREHDPKTATRFVESALKLGVRVSVDLIYDTILDSPRALRQELQNAANLGVGHISCYALSFDENSRFFAAGRDLTRKNSLCYEVLGTLEALGFAQYEVSNFAKKCDKNNAPDSGKNRALDSGKESQKCAHNLGYWRGENYLGVGLGAVGRQGLARFYKNSEINAYVKNPTHKKVEVLSEENLRLERIFLGLRSEVGVGLADVADSPNLAALLASGKCVKKGERICATNYFLADELALWLA